MKILVVEDEKNLNDVINRYLAKLGHIVKSAYDGLEAQDFLALYDFDLILLDIMLPHKDGMSLLEDYRRQGKKTPVIFLTACFINLSSYVSEISNL